MLYAYFGGMGADRHSCYELLLEQSGIDYTVTVVDQRNRTTRGMVAWAVPWSRRPRGPRRPATTYLYRGRNAKHALRALFHASRAANLGEPGQRFCYVLPSVSSNPNALAALLPRNLRYDGSLPFHPQLWQVGRPLDTLPLGHHSEVGTDVHLFGEERARWIRA